MPTPIDVDDGLWTHSTRGRHREGWLLHVLALALIVALIVAVMALASGLRIDPSRLSL